MKSRFAKIIASFVLVALVTTQVFGVLAYFMPEQKISQVNTAQAALNYSMLGVSKAQGTSAAITSVPSINMFDVHKFTDDWYKQIALGVAYSFAQKFMQRFVSKLTEKYKIRNFLYYDQILTNYYLGNFIRDKISDPDLRQIYVLMESAYVTGQPTGTTPGTGPDPRRAVIPRLRKAVADLYTRRTGINPVALANPAPDTNANNYLAQTRSYYLNHPGYTEANLQREFGEFQSAATTAAQLEVLVGSGLKSGRYVGGHCDIAELPQKDGQKSKISTSADCGTRGGTWRESTLDQARSFIDNPSTYVDKWMDGMVKQITGTNFDPNNFWFTLGNAFGNFLVNRLMIDKPNGVLNEDPRGYVPTTSDLGEGTPGAIVNADLDGDGIPDGYDVDGDGVLDSCTYGGTAPACTGSRSLVDIGAGGSGGGGTGPCADDGLGTANFEGDLASAIDEVISTNPGGIADALNTAENSGTFLDEVAAVLQSRGFEATSEVLNGNGNDSSTNDIIAIWKPGELKLERYDAIASAGAFPGSSDSGPLRDKISPQYTGDIPVEDCV